MRFGHIQAVFSKELRDAVRDRRSLLAALSYTLIGPLFFVVIVTVQLNALTSERPLEVAVSGAERAGDLMGFLEQQEVELTRMEAPFAAVDEAVAAVRAERYTLVLMIPEDYAERFTQGRDLAVKVVGSSADRSDRARRLERYVEAYGEQLGRMRLLARGVHPGVAQAVSVDRIDTATRQSRTAILLVGLIFFWVIAAFFGGMNIAIDATAGERERKSLESLLSQPATTLDLVFGKWLVASLFGVIVGGLTVLITRGVLTIVPLHEIGLQVVLGAGTLMQIIAVVASLAPVFAALQMLISTLARSYKEAQTYAMMIYVLPIAGFVLEITGGDAAERFAMLPMLGQQAIVGDLLRGDPVLAWQLASALGTSALIVIAALWGTAGLLRRERIIFGR